MRSSRDRHGGGGDRRVGPPYGRFVEALAAALSAEAGVTIAADDFAPIRLPATSAHTRRRRRVGHGARRGRRHRSDPPTSAAATRQAIAATVPLRERRARDWDVETVPQVVATTHAGMPVLGYPALLDDDDSVSLRILTNADLQRHVMRGGVRRLLLLGGALRRAGPGALSNAPGWRSPRPPGRRRAGDRVRRVAVDGVLDEHELPWDADAFDVVRADVRSGPAFEVDAWPPRPMFWSPPSGCGRRSTGWWRRRCSRRSTTPTSSSTGWSGPGSCCGPGPVASPTSTATSAASSSASAPGRRRRPRPPADGRRRAARGALRRHLRRQGRSSATTAEAVEVGWQLEELRMSLFAQPVGVSGTVSPRRIARALAAL